MWKRITAIVLIAAFVILAGWDVFVIQKGGVYSSISNTIWGWAREYPLFTLSFGVIIGHLFWGPKPIKEDTEKP